MIGIFACVDAIGERQDRPGALTISGTSMVNVQFQSHW